MSFADTYSTAVIDARRDRSRRARFVARLLMPVTAVLLFATMQAEPGLRKALMEGASAAVLEIVSAGKADAPATAPEVTSGSTGLRDRVRVNRPQTANDDLAAEAPDS